MSGAREEALSGFVAKAMSEIAALGAAGGSTQGESFIAADHSIEEFLPLHILMVAARQLCKVLDHQVRQLISVRESEILPEVPSPRGSAGD